MFKDNTSLVIVKPRPVEIPAEMVGISKNYFDLCERLKEQPVKSGFK